MGGYFELELPETKEYHHNAIKLNSGRNALWYVLKTHRPKKIYLPYYICEVVLDPIQKEKIEFEFYHINKKFEPELHFDLYKNEFIICVNYFGICDQIIKNLATNIKNLIIDNTQAFFCPPNDVISFYSPRKFFGVVDGSYLYTNKYLEEELTQSISYDKCIHILKRYELGANEGYSEHKQIEQKFINQPIKRMSKLTQRILSSIDYKKCKQIRERNFLHIHNHLKDINELKIDIQDLNGPMMYPFLIKRKGIKEFLVKNKIYVPTLWESVLKNVDENSAEAYLTKYMNPLPIDQRYNIDDMNIIIEKINEVLK